VKEFPYRTLVEKAGVDSGFDRQPRWEGDCVLLSASRHDMPVVVGRQSDDGLRAWFPRQYFSASLLDLSGVALAETHVPAPRPDALPAPILCDLSDTSALRRLLRQLQRTALDEPPGATLKEDSGPAEPLAALNTALRALPESTEITREVIARVGQQCFREALIAFWNGRCPITGLSILPLLRASHIKPWARCETARERLDIYNGLLLAPHLDAAFDGGWITFSDTGALLLSPALPPADARALALPGTAQLRGLQAAHAPYLAYHRAAVFRQTGSIAGPG